MARDYWREIWYGIFMHCRRPWHEYIIHTTWLCGSNPAFWEGDNDNTPYGGYD